MRTHFVCLTLLALTACSHDYGPSNSMTSATDFENKTYDGDMSAEAYAQSLCERKLGLETASFTDYKNSTNYLGNGKWAVEVYVVPSGNQGRAFSGGQCTVNTETGQVDGSEVPVG